MTFVIYLPIDADRTLVYSKDSEKDWREKQSTTVFSLYFYQASKIVRKALMPLTTTGSGGGGQ